MTRPCHTLAGWAPATSNQALSALIWQQQTELVLAPRCPPGALAELCLPILCPEGCHSHFFLFLPLNELHKQ